MRAAASLALLLCGGCLSGGAVVVRGDDGRAQAPDNDRVMRQVMRQDLYMQQALDARLNDKVIAKVRSGDPGAMDRAHKELIRLTQAVDRGTWIRETVGELMKEDIDPRLAQEFDRAGRLRAQSLQAAGQLADAMIDGGGLTMADLKSAFEWQRKAQASEDRIARLPRGPNEPTLAPAPLPVPSPLDHPAARLAGNAPEAATQALSAEDAARVHAQAADLDRQRAEMQHNATAQADADPMPPGVPQTEAQAPSSTLTIANDALEIITRKRPRSITLREDGLFDLSCADGEYLVSPDGKLVRKDPPAQQ
jgi:hypothetical protein